MTKIEWTDETWNPTRGCSRVSEGCRNCYAERQAARFSNSKRSDDETVEPFHLFAERTPAGPRWTGRVELIESKLTEPLHWKKPRRVFVNSMSDLFHEALSDNAIQEVFAVMALCPHIKFQVLTKRAQRMREWLAHPHRVNFTAIRAANLASTHFDRYEQLTRAPYQWPLANVWLGVSVEDQANKDRIDLLRQTPAAVRFLSIEPLLEDFGMLNPLGIHWVIVGGESGPQARPCDLAWIRSIRDQCRAASVPLFVKQLGARPGYQRKDGWRDIDLKDPKGGNWDEWPRDLRIREFSR
jgi:protein gp37